MVAVPEFKAAMMAGLTAGIRCAADEEAKCGRSDSTLTPIDARVFVPVCCSFVKTVVKIGS